MIRVLRTPFKKDIEETNRILQDLKLEKADFKRKGLKNPEVSQKIKAIEVQLSRLAVVQSIFDHNVVAVKESWQGLYVARTYESADLSGKVLSVTREEIAEKLGYFRSMSDDLSYPLVFNDPEHCPALVDMLYVYQKLEDFVDPDEY